MLAGLAALADDQMNCPGGPLRKRGRHAMIRLGDLFPGVVGGALVAVVARVWWYGFGVTCLPPVMGTPGRAGEAGRC